MKRNIRSILISIEADSDLDTKKNTLPVKITSLTELSKQVSQGAELPRESKEDSHESITNIGTPLQTDRWIYRIVVSTFALTIIFCISSAVLLQFHEKKIPEVITGLGIGALGGLAGLLAPTLSKK
ncbi:hypothetical protein NIES22_72860 (plasmid) [Calothrix brevissima NIES-22]|nr:hypothetical protein NIES22_72860 [Calothrix brevissima NIES-22]